MSMRGLDASALLLRLEGVGHILHTIGKDTDLCQQSVCLVLANVTDDITSALMDLMQAEERR